MKPGKRELPEQLAEPFDTGLLDMFDSTAALSASMASLAEQGIVYGNTDSTALLTTGERLSVEQKHERFYQGIFSVAFGRAMGLEARIDPIKYIGRVIEPAIASRVDLSMERLAKSVHVVSRKLPRDVRHMKSGFITNEAMTSAETTVHDIRSGIAAIVEHIPDAITRAQAILAEAEAVVPAFKDEVASDPNKQFAIVRLLSSDIGSIDVHGFQDPGLALATFFGIADFDSKDGGSHTANELAALLKDGQFDEFIAEEVLSGALEKLADGDHLVPEELELCKMIEAVHFFHKVDVELIVRAFSEQGGIDRWSTAAQYLLINRREWYERSIAANQLRIQSLINENYLGAFPIDDDTFLQYVDMLFRENNAISMASKLTAATQLRARAEIAQRDKRRRLLSRLVGGEALANASAEQAIERPLRFLHTNGDSSYYVDDEARHIIDNYLGIYDRDPVLATDLSNSMNHLVRMSPKEMARLLAQANGLRTLAGQHVRVNGQRVPIHRMKPKRVPGLATQSPVTDKMLILFVQLPKDQGIGVLDVVRRDRLDRVLSQRR